MILDDPEWIKLDPQTAQAVTHGKFVIVPQRENQVILLAISVHFFRTLPEVCNRLLRRGLQQPTVNWINTLDSPARDRWLDDVKFVLSKSV